MYSPVKVQNMLDALHSRVNCVDIAHTDNVLEFAYNMPSLTGVGGRKLTEPAKYKLVLTRLSEDYYQGSVMVAWVNKNDTALDGTGVQPVLMFRTGQTPTVLQFTSSYGVEWNAARHLKIIFDHLLPLFVEATTIVAL